MQRTAFCFLVLALFAAWPAGAQPLAEMAYRTASYITGANAAATHNTESKAITLPQLMEAVATQERASRIIGFTKAERPIRVYFFPGRSNKRALIIGGVHGTELASVEVANRLIKGLATGDTPYYNVLIIPSLFPDNAAQALEQVSEIGSTQNIGRYSSTAAPDPNRQMPPLGKPYDPETNADALGRAIEYENGLLLQLIQTYKPQRIVNIHAIRDTAQSGVFADPRTDARGYALEFASDSNLALNMAQHIVQQGGTAAGNRCNGEPTAVYHKDPPVAAPGQWQRRSCHSMRLPQNRGHGVSLGSWASTAVQDSTNVALNRPAIRLLTMEFPGYKRPQDYAASQQEYYEKQVALYAASIQHVFLQSLFADAPSPED